MEQKIKIKAELVKQVSEVMADALCKIILDNDGENNLETKNIISSLAKTRLDLRKFEQR